MQFCSEAWIHLAWMVKRLLHKKRLWHSLGTYLYDISAARKATLLLHSAVLENGSGAADVMKWRTSVRGFCSDQGAEHAIPTQPVGQYGIDVAELLMRAQGRDDVPSAEEYHQAMFLPETLERPEHLHIIFNALEMAQGNCKLIGRILD